MPEGEPAEIRSACIKEEGETKKRKEIDLCEMLNAFEKIQKAIGHIDVFSVYLQFSMMAITADTSSQNFFSFFSSASAAVHTRRDIQTKGTREKSQNLQVNIAGKTYGRPRPGH